VAIAIEPGHQELAAGLRSFLARREAVGETRRLDGDTGLPAYWPEFAATGWLALHIPEKLGGSGFGPLEAAIVAEELGRACAAGPFLPTAVVLDAIAGCDEAPTLASLDALTDGSAFAGLALADVTDDGDTVRGTVPAVSVKGAAVIAVAAGRDLVVLDPAAHGVRVDHMPALDPAHPGARLTIEDAPVLSRLPGARERAEWLLQLLTAAEAAGVADGTCAMASAYASERFAFGRPIGQFQAVKHQCADMAVAAELAVAAVWDAARREGGGASAVPVHSAAVGLSLEAAVDNARRTIQVHGGIGFTWEHDAHLYLRRAAALRALLGDVPRRVYRELGRMRPIEPAPALVDLPPSADSARSDARAFAERYQRTPEADRVRLLVDEGYLYPHWPPPWGRGASAADQLVMEAELRGLPRYEHLGVNVWTLPIVLPTLMRHGTEEQRERWLRPTLLGEQRWCQLFSEPGTGSDLAALTTRAERADGGWRVRGQKVWTSSAREADLGFALVRTDPASRRNRGISCMVIDMRAEGVTVRPLRQITGESSFNEVFLDDVFVPDTDVIGAIDEGWRVARTTLGNERISLTSQEHGGLWRGVEALVGDADDPLAEHGLGRLAAVQHALAAMQSRMAARAVIGGEPGPEGNIGKLVGAELAQRLAEFGQELRGARGIALDPDDVVTTAFLQTRSLTIAGGTSEILRNVIAETILGLPRDPLPPS
jgi:alkylation response protein AidB-like acyl-CoA dehydrogenase